MENFLNSMDKVQYLENGRIYLKRPLYNGFCELLVIDQYNQTYSVGFSDGTTLYTPSDVNRAIASFARKARSDEDWQILDEIVKEPKVALDMLFQDAPAD